MTDQPYTPTTEDIRLAHAESVTFHVMEEPELTEANNMFDRWYVAEIAAAEQRGAVKALRDAVNEDRMYNGISYFVPEEALLDRADRIADQEGDDENLP